MDETNLHEEFYRLSEPPRAEFSTALIVEHARRVRTRSVRRRAAGAVAGVAVLLGAVPVVELSARCVGARRQRPCDRRQPRRPVRCRRHPVRGGAR